MLAWFGLAATLAASAGTATDGDIGGCAWRALPAEVRINVLDAYRGGSRAALIALRDRDGDVRVAVAKCAGREDVPPPWIAGAVASVVLQEGSVQALAPLGISRKALEQAWDQAPEAARQCTRANAAKAFGLMDQPCPDRAAPAAFVSALGVDLKTNPTTASHILFFMNAGAQRGWANGLIRKLMERGPPPPRAN